MISLQRLGYESKKKKEVCIGCKCKQSRRPIPKKKGGDKPTSLCSKINSQGELQMICGVKIEIYSEQLCRELLNSPFLNFKTPVEEKTGLVHFPKTDTYRHLRFALFESNRIEIRGSLHKYWREENFSDFSFSDLKKCLNDLQEKFKIDLSEARISNVEFGVNVSPLFNPYEFCENLIVFRGKNFDRMKTRNGKPNIGFECGLNQYSVKIYDKAKQYLKTENILRVEIPVCRMAYLSGVGIKNLADLKEKTVLKALGRVLLECYSNVVVNDNTVRKARLTANEKRIYSLCSNPKEWELFNRKQRYKRKKQFERIVSKYGKRNWKEETEKMISDKWAMLLNM